MKKNKVIEVTICDLCNKEANTRRCGQCGMDACSACSVNYQVTAVPWVDYPPYVTTLSIVWAGERNPELAGIFCNQCSPRALLRANGFVSCRSEDKAV